MLLPKISFFVLVLLVSSGFGAILYSIFYLIFYYRPDRLSSDKMTMPMHGVQVHPVTAKR